MGHKLLVALVVIAVFVAAGAAFVLLSGGDDTSNTAPGTTTTTTTPTSTTAAPSSAPTTTVATTTTTPTSTSAPVPDACGAAGGPVVLAAVDGVAGASDRAQVDQCRFAAVDATWAAVRLVARPGASFAPTTVVLHDVGGAWSVVGVDSAACSQTPQQVRVDLGLPCANSGGGV